ncbi:MAG: hypothetical protein HUJ99_00645 [Bacteroidaceae bacterium]|mgnify:CR=1 FL=1|nr:hypothetical protein [Bacteroidaceae bacterium]
MTDDEKKKLSQFEAHVRQLMEKYLILKKENEDLYQLIDEQEKAIKELTTQTQKLQQSYNNLKMARMIEISDDEMKNAKQRLSKMVREVDKCIALLKV